MLELHEAIALVHEAVEGRYDLTGFDLQQIEWFLCDLQEHGIHATATPRMPDITTSGKQM